MITMKELKKIATEKVNPRSLSEDCHVASVGAALVTVDGNVYAGVCIDTGCGMGFCAEHSAIAQMITNNESEIKMIIAMGEDDIIFPPCGRCREFMYQINRKNLKAEIMVAEDKIVTLEELLPHRLEL